MNENKSVEGMSELLIAMADEAGRREARVRRSGEWCYFCGATDNFARCGCALPESLACINQRVCRECRDAHRIIADHLRKMFSARIVNRVSSIREKLFYQLCGAAESLAEKHGMNPEAENGLKFLLCQACAFDQTKIEFRSTITDAFHRSRFADFQGLARELEREQGVELRSLMCKWLTAAK